MKPRPANWKPRIPKDAVLSHISVPHETIDDYDLPAHIEVDYSKAKPNRFAGRVKYTHGGARKGAGRKPVSEPAESHTITLYKSHVKYLRRLDPNLSRAIRKMIEAGVANK